MFFISQSLHLNCNDGHSFVFSRKNETKKNEKNENNEKKIKKKWKKNEKIEKMNEKTAKTRKTKQITVQSKKTEHAIWNVSYHL